MCNCLIKPTALCARASLDLDDLVGSLTVAPLSTAHGINYGPTIIVIIIVVNVVDSLGNYLFPNIYFSPMSINYTKA